MNNKSEKTNKKKELKPEDLMKYEIADELGLGEKLLQVGWGGLTAKETGRIGGIITRKKKAIMGQIKNIQVEKKA
ncbi:MAG: small, acid-soluble spore protein, alpha/beta type [Lutisporaceae bacterium]